MTEGLTNRQEGELVDRFAWRPGDVIIHKSPSDLQRALKAQGRTFIPSRSEEPKNKKEAE